MKTYPYAVMAMALTWMFLKGAVTLQSFLEGLFFAVLTVFTTRAIIKPEFRQTFPRVLRRIPPYLRYLAFFVRAVVHGNVDVAFRSLHPRLPIYPGILAVNVEGMSDLEIAMMANTITLTPGTLTLDVDPDRGLMFVHTINARDLEGVRQEIKKVERHVRRVLR